MPIQCSVWNDTGRRRSDASSVSKMTFNTHSVMISGIQMRSPVIRYFLRAPGAKSFFTAEMKRPGHSPGRSCYSVVTKCAAQAAAFDSDFFSGFASDLVSDLESVLVSVLVSVFLSADFFAPPLKSVAYQPVPFS